MDHQAEEAAGADAAGKGAAVSIGGDFVYLGEKVYACPAGRGKKAFFCPLRGQGSVVHAQRKYGEAAGGVYAGTVSLYAKGGNSAASSGMGSQDGAALQLLAYEIHENPLGDMQYGEEAALVQCAAGGETIGMLGVRDST